MTAPFPNAAPPPGALFDNAPAVPNMNTTADVPVTSASVPPTVPAHLTPASRVCQDRGGRWTAVDVLMQYGQPLPLALAVKRVAIGRTVFVRREDAGAVLVAVNNPMTADFPR